MKQQMIDPRAFWAEIEGVKPIIDAMVRSGLQEAERTTILEMLSQTFDAHAPGTSFEFGVAPDGVFELIISANGIRSNVSGVQQIVRAAPTVPDWRVIAFKPRQDLRLQIDLGSHRCDVAKTRCRWRENQDRLDVTLFLDVPEDVPKDVLMHLKFLILDVALGEYDVMVHVGTIEARPLSKSPADTPSIEQFIEALDRFLAPLQKN